MSKLDTQSTVTLILNGEQTKTSLKEVTQAVKATTAALSAMKQADDPAGYHERIELLGKLKAAQSELRAEIVKGDAEQKTFFSDFKEGFEEIKNIAAGVTLGTLISQGVRGALDGIKELFAGAQKAFEEHELAEASLANKIRATGDISGQTTEKLEKYQKTLEAQTGIDETVVAKGEDILLTYTNIRGKIYDQALPAVLDLTAAQNNGRVSMEGVQASANMLGKALDNVSNAKRALRQMGITLSEQESKEIDTRRKANDVMGAQQVILDAVNKRYGDLRNTLANTDVGALQKYDTAFESLSRKIGAFTEATKASLAAFFLPLIQGMAETGSEAEKLSKAFYEQAEKVKSLEQTTTPLINRYDELKTKGELNRTEQVELNKIIATLSQTIPTAVTEWDKYGKAIGINTDKAREFIKMQKAVMQIQNKTAIDETQARLEALQGQHDRLLGELSYGKTPIMRGANDSMSDISMRAFTGEEITKMTKEVGDLQTKIEMATLGLKGLKGGLIDEPTTDPTVVKPQGGLTEAEKSAAESAKAAAAAKAAALKKQQEEYLAASAALDAKLKEFNASELADTLAKNDKEIAALENKYNKEWTEATAALKKLKDSKFVNQAEVDKQQDEVDALSVKKQTAIAELKLRQEKDLTEKITAFRNSLAGKLATELDKEIELINAKFDSLAKDVGDNPDQQKKLEAERAAEITDAKLREVERFREERQKIEAEGLVDGATNDKIELAKINKKFDDEIEALKKKFSVELQETKEFQDAVNRINNNRDGAINQYDKKKAQEQNNFLISESERTSSFIFSLAKKNRDADTNAQIKALETQKTAELSNKNLTEAQKQAITDDTAKKEAAVKLAAWKADQQAAVGQAIINGALAVLKAEAQVGPLGAFVIPGIIATTVVEIAEIESQKPPEFGDGGLLGGIVDGPSHAGGGVDLINSLTGAPVANVEGGEALMVLSKQTTQNNNGLIKELLYNSQFRNGAPVNVNAKYATIPATTQYANGGVIPGRSYQSSTTATQLPGNSFDMGDVLKELQLTREAIKNQKVYINRTTFDIEEKNVQIIRDRAQV